jgi:uncharacterized protein (TIGR03580 family)
MIVEVVLKSLVVGALGGAAIAAGAARMFYAPKLQGMGAFRTIGEMNACNGDPISHLSFGAGFYITSAAAVVGTGALTQDVLHRVLPNWTAAIVSLFTKDKTKRPFENIFLMMVVGAFVGAFVFVTLNTVSSLVPIQLSTIAKSILTPAANNMITIVMPLIFLWAAIDDGKITGSWAFALGGIMQMISGNALPGIIFGILIGSNAQEKGHKAKSTVILIAVVIALILAIAYFRGFHTKLITQFFGGAN